MNVPASDGEMAIPCGRIAVTGAEQNQHLPQIFFWRAAGLRSVGRVGDRGLLRLQPCQAGGEPNGEQHNSGASWTNHRADYSTTKLRDGELPASEQARA